MATRLVDVRNRLAAGLANFAWREFAQLGANARPPETPSPWVQDPEALTLLALVVADDDPRLRQSVFDWLAHNEKLISTRRLRALSKVGGDDGRVDAVLSWVATKSGRPAPTPKTTQFEQIRMAATGHATHPELSAPINLAFRLRELFGLGVRSEVIRVMLTDDRRIFAAKDLTEPAGYATRNVFEALSALGRSGTITTNHTPSGQSFQLDRDRWGAMLGIQTWPDYRNWPRLTRALRLLLVRLPSEHDLLLPPRRTGLALIHDIRDDLNGSGIAVREGDRLDEIVTRALKVLEPPDH